MRLSVIRQFSQSKSMSFVINKERDVVFVNARLRSSPHPSCCFLRGVETSLSSIDPSTHPPLPLAAARSFFRRREKGKKKGKTQKPLVAAAATGVETPAFNSLRPLCPPSSQPACPSFPAQPVDDHHVIIGEGKRSAGYCGRGGPLGCRPPPLPFCPIDLPPPPF